MLLFDYGNIFFYGFNDCIDLVFLEVCIMISNFE